MKNLFDRLFGLTQSGSMVRREVRAGLTTFLTMAYILLVNPDILGQAISVPNAAAQLLSATALAAAFGSILMGLLARYPFAQAPGMGLNAYFAFTVVLGQHVPWQTALGAVFVVGLIFVLLSQGGIREAILNSLPPNLKFAMTAGVGLFLAFIGLKKAGLVVAHPVTLVTLGSLHHAGPLLALFGLALTAILLARRVPAAILLGIATTTALALLLRAPVFEGPGGALSSFAGLSGSPLRMPVWPGDLFLKLDIRGCLRPAMAGVVFTMLFVAIFDTAGTLIGLSAKAGFLDREGNLPRAGRAFTSDALASSLGALFGSSTTTCYIESAAGIEEGGRTGLTAVIVGVCFLLATCLWPLIALVPGVATAPALILVGAMMISNLRFVEWRDYTETVPVFLTVVGMPLTYSIAHGVSLGIVCYVVLKLGTGSSPSVSATTAADGAPNLPPTPNPTSEDSHRKDQRLRPGLVILAALLILRYSLLPA